MCSGLFYVEKDEDVLDGMDWLLLLGCCLLDNVAAAHEVICGGFLLRADVCAVGSFLYKLFGFPPSTGLPRMDKIIGTTIFNIALGSSAGKQRFRSVHAGQQPPILDGIR